MSACTAVNCIDGRVQLPVLKFLKRHSGAGQVDSVTEPGPVRVLAEQKDAAPVDSIVRRVRASVHLNESRLIAVAAHHDCRGNPVPREVQMGQLQQAVAFLKRRFSECEVVGLWVDDRWKVSVVPQDEAAQDSMAHPHSVQTGERPIG